MTLNISIAMCTCNGARFVEAQLESLINQAHLPYEIVICDDISDDQTINIVKAFAATAPFPMQIAVNEERLGYRRNFMQAASRCGGDVIAFCDQDDVWRADKLALVAAEFSDPAVLMVHHNARLVRADGEPFGRINQPGAFPAIAPPLSQNPWHYCLGFTQTFRRDLNAMSHLRAALMGEHEDEWTAHDQWISFLASSLGQVKYIDEDLVDYRQHGKNLYGMNRDIRHKSIISMISEKISDFRDYRILKKVSERRRQILNEIRSVSADSHIAKNSLLAEKWYDRLFRLYSLRCDLYISQKLYSRLSSWLKLIRIGGYSSNEEVFFRKRSGCRDFIQGVLFHQLRNKAVPSADFSLIVAPSTNVSEPI